MKQVPTNVALHSLSSLSKADLSVYDSVDDQVLSDYAVSFSSTSTWSSSAESQQCTDGYFLAIQHDRFDLCLDQRELRFRTRCPYGFYGRCFQERRWYDWQTYSLIQQNASSCKYYPSSVPWPFSGAWPGTHLDILRTIKYSQGSLLSLGSTFFCCGTGFMRVSVVAMRNEYGFSCSLLFTATKC